jgi:DNA-binding CsgD family transcriptional regulator
MPVEVIGRGDELVAIEAFLANVEQGPAALVLSGEAGIGKTILWEAALEEATERFGRALSCRGLESEAGLSFAGLSDLLAGVLPEVADELLPLRRRALEVALLIAEPGEEVPDPRTIGVAVLDVLRHLAERGPVIVAVDDLQWLDVPSAGALQLALRRLHAERVGFLATVRQAPEISVPFELDRSLSQSRYLQLSLGPLAIGALHQLLKSRLGLELPRPELTRVGEATGGNAFFALELGRELSQDTIRLESGKPLRLPGSLSTLLGRRLEALPQRTRDVLLVAAASGRPTAEVVAAAHGNRAEALEALELAAHEHVIVLDGSRIRFAHPLLSSVCYEEAPLWRRQAVHRALAGAVIDIEERARHLALAAETSDSEVASALDSAAEQAAARGATAAAGELAELAAELTPAELADQARGRRFAAGWFHRLAGDFERACTIFEHLLAEIPSGVERSDVLYALATTGRADVPTRVRLCEEAAAEAAGDDVRLVQILGFLAISRWIHGDAPRALAEARDGLLRAERLGDPRLLATALMRAGLMETMRLEITPGLLERGVSIEHDLERPLLFHDSPTFNSAVQLIMQDELDRARERLDTVGRNAEARGDEHTRSWVLLVLIYLEWYAGRWQRALACATDAAEVAEQTQERQYAGMVSVHKAVLEADLGLVEQARASGQSGLAFSQEVGDEIFTTLNLAALGHAEFVLGNVDGAADYLCALPARILAAGHRQPGIYDFWPDTIETLIALGELEQARTHLEQYEELARLASRRTGACAARSRGLLAAAEGDLDDGLAAIEASQAKLDELPYPLERGRTLLCLGVVRRQAQRKKAAREALEQALAVFEELGARPWAEKARAELRRVSGRRPVSEELTETERRVAELAAQGRSNREIAAELFMGVSTVEMHLSRVYGKLGVRRAGLGVALAGAKGESAMSMDEAAQT